ncbi:MAG TPA: NAD-dependent epimerase/dehydratase family protein [Opitutaceae bacterium]
MSAEENGFLTGRRLIVFGAGYVGSAVVLAAREQGMEVTALTRNPDKAAALALAGVRTVVADLSSSEWHAQLSPDTDFILNCVSSGGGGLEGYRKSYVDGLRSILDWARSTPSPGMLIYTGSTSVYPQDGGVRVSEEASTAESTGNARILLEAEDLVRAWAGRWFILRLAGIYGPGRHHLLDQLRAGADTLAGQGEHHLNLIHRDDIVTAILAAFRAPSSVPSGIFNVADDGAAPKATLVKWIAARLGCPEPAFSGEPVTGRRRGTPDRVIANDRIKRVLGWQARYPTFRDGYAAFLANPPA